MKEKEINMKIFTRILLACALILCLTSAVCAADGWEDDACIGGITGSECALSDFNEIRYAVINARGEEEAAVSEEIVPEIEFPFADVSDQDPNCAAIYDVFAKGLMLGVSDTEFAPEATLTRGMLVTILYRLAGEPAFMNDNVFDDVESGSWYEKAIVWANGKGIVFGYGDGKFGPEDPVTREQMAAIFYRYAEYKEFDTEVDPNTNFLSFDDVFEISEYAMAPMFWAIYNDMITETEGWLFPAEGATRGDAAKFLSGFCGIYAE